MKLFILVVIVAVGLAACAGTPSRDAVATNQQNGFQHCFNQKLLHPDSIKGHIYSPRNSKRYDHHRIVPPPSATPDINAITQACL